MRPRTTGAFGLGIRGLLGLWIFVGLFNVAAQEKAATPPPASQDKEKAATPPATGQEEAAATLPANDPAVLPFLGTWKLAAQIQGNPVEMTLEVFGMRGKAEAALSSAYQPQPQSIKKISKADKGLKMTYDAQFGPNNATVNLTAALEGDKMKGSMGDESGAFKADFEGTKRGPALTPQDVSTLDVAGLEKYLGTWKLSASLQGNPAAFTIQFLDSGGKLVAVIAGPPQPFPMLIKQISKAGDGLKLEYELKMGPSTLPVSVNAKLQGEELAGDLADSNGLFKADFKGGKGPDAPDLVPGAKAAARAAAAGAAAGGPGGRRGGRRGGGGGFGGGGAMARLTLKEKNIRINYGNLAADSKDHEAFLALKDGEVFQFTGARATRLNTELNLNFGGTTIKKGNISANYPGVYSLWLKKAGDGWKLVFNEQGDAWGTMHDAKVDVAEVPLVAGESEKPAETLAIELKEDQGGGILRIAWGKNQWTAKFTAE